MPIAPLSSPGLYTVPFTAANTRQFNDPRFAALPSPRHMDENLKTPYVQQMFLGTQYEFKPGFLMEFNYITTAGRGLTGIIDINTFPGRTRGGNSTRPNTNINADNFRTNAFGSIYHGGQIGVRNRMWHGLQLNAHYTYSKAIDELSDAFNADARHGNFRPQNPANIRLDRARADFDVRHRFVSGFTYEVPFMKKNRWLGGWVMSGIIQIQSGVPFTVFHGGQDPNADGFTSDRAVFLGTDSGSIYTGNSPADGFFNTSMFVGMNTRVAQLGAAAACGPNNGEVISNTRWWCDGTLGRNTFTGPGFANLDFGIHKKFKIREGSSLQLQANAFNLFNHANFGIPVGNINSSNFGRSIFTVGTPRVIQLAIRFDF